MLLWLCKINFTYVSDGMPTPLTFSTALGTRYMPTEDVSLSDQIGVVDMTLSCLVTWLEGHSLAQTVFTNLYLHAPLQVNGLFTMCRNMSYRLDIQLLGDRVIRPKLDERINKTKGLKIEKTDGLIIIYRIFHG